MLKKVGLGLLATLVLVLGVFGIVGAQDGGDPPPPEGNSGPRVEVIEDVAALLGMTADELKAAVTDGQTVAELAAEKGITLDDVVDVLVAPLAANLRERLENGQSVLPRPRQPRPNPQQATRRAALDIVAETLGMPVEEVRDALVAGQTVAELAEAQGVPVVDIVNALLVPAIERLDQAVAAGKMTQAEADVKLAEITGMLEEKIASGDFRPPPPTQPPGRRPSNGRPNGGRPDNRGPRDEQLPTPPVAPESDR